MFISYNLLEFGEKLKEIRKNLGLSQLDIQNLAGVSSDALRRIEKGEVIPRYETLELLSSIYKEDLLELLKRSRVNRLLTEYHDILDDIIITYDDRKIKELEEEIRAGFSNGNNSSVINPNEVIQLLLLIRGTALYHSRFSSDHKDAHNVLLDALRLTIPDFKMMNYKLYKYSYIELRILLLLSVLQADDNNEIKLSNQILIFIRERLLQGTPSKYTDYLVIKIYTNLAYNHHLEDNHRNVIKVTTQGIAYCVEHETMHGLNLLYYRKGIAEFLTRKRTYMETLLSSFFILKVMNRNDLLDIYLEVTEQKYGIQIPLDYLKSK